MPSYVYRSEAEIDSTTFLAKARAVGYAPKVMRQEVRGLDLVVEFRADVDLDRLVAVASTVVDGHIIVRTLRQGTLATCDLAE